jgi:hypothetical protein
MIQTVSKTTTGNSTGNIGSNIRGKLLAVKVTSDSNATNAFDIVLAGANSGVPILTDTTIANNSSVWWHPRALASKVADGADATDFFVEIPIQDEPVAFTITNAGTTGIITITLVYDTEQ